MIKILTSVTLLLLFFSGCAPIPTTPDTRSLEEKKADLIFAIAELSGEYDVVEKRNDFYLNHKFASARYLKVSTFGENILLKLVD